MSNLSDFLFPKATEQQAKDGTSNSVLMTPSTTMAALGAAMGSQTFTSSGTFNKPANARWILVEAIGAGGAGGRTNPNGVAGGGGGGGYSDRLFQASDLPSSVSVVVGSGGTGLASGNGPGADGGSSQFGSFVLALGGNGGEGGAPGGSRKGGASGSGATSGGGYAGGAGGGNDPGPVPGGGAVKGGGGGGAGISTGHTAGIGVTASGVSALAGNGGNGGTGSNLSGSNGVAPGGGGGGCVAGTSDAAKPGNGARGEVRVYWW